MICKYLRKLYPVLPKFSLTKFKSLFRNLTFSFIMYRHKLLSTPPMSINNFTNDDAGVNFYTGLETLTKFYFVLRTLGPAAHCLNYIYHKVSNISIPDQFFLVLCKLRRHTTNFELSRLFGVSEKTVSNIFFTWILFYNE